MGGGGPWTGGSAGRAGYAQDVRLPGGAAAAGRHPGTNGWLGTWGEIAGCPPS